MTMPKPKHPGLRSGSASPIRHVDAGHPTPAGARFHPGAGRAIKTGQSDRAVTGGRRGSARKLPG